MCLSFSINEVKQQITQDILTTKENAIKTIITIILIGLFVCNANAETRSERDTREAKERLEQQMRYDKQKVWDNCIMDTRTRTRVSWKKNTVAANECFNTRWNGYLIEQRILAEQLAAEAESLKATTRQRKHN